MGLFQNLLETYERCSGAVGWVPVDADGNANEKKTLLPICHMTFKSEIQVTLDQDGSFVRASRDSKQTTIIIPCTEGSSGRSSGIAPHPLCDQLDYVGGIQEAKTAAYLEGLAAWKTRHPALGAIDTYVAGGSILQDLVRQQIFKENEYLAHEEPPGPQALDFEKIRKLGVRFTVVAGMEAVNVWESVDLRKAWIDHVLGGSAAREADFDYMSGTPVTSVAAQHPKNIHSMSGNAKLLSCNDTSGFTFRGRFAAQDDAVLVDYVQSQKMHQMLRWLIANYGYAVDSQVIVTWAVDAQLEVKAHAQDNSYDLFGDMTVVNIDTEGLLEARGAVDASYAQKFRLLLQGYGRAEGIRQHARKICIAAFDAATTGRMGLVFYQELPEDDYLEDLVNWHSDTSYYLTAWKRARDADGKEKSIPVRYKGAPSYDDILFAVYGKSHGDKSYDTLKKKTRKLLLECMFGNSTLPESMVHMAANRASHPMSFTDTGGKFSENDWNRGLDITCALVRKWHKQKGEIGLALDTERRDRDYLYGRLLSVADRLERKALYKADRQDVRATNAVKLMSAFQVKPYSTWGQLYQQLVPYRNQLNGAGYYQSVIDEILEKFQNGEYEKNDPLSPLYLLGYSHQNRELNKKISLKYEEETDYGNAAE